MSYNPVARLRTFAGRLSEAFGWRYVASVVVLYGINQGIGESLVYFVRQYYILDTLGLSATRMGQVLGFAGIPWQLKSLFGVLSDTVPINGRHRSPYIVLAGVLGTIATLVLAVLPAEVMSFELVAIILLLMNVNFSMPDVMIDATVAERSQQRPELAADLQALCWGSNSMISIVAQCTKGYLYVLGGARLVLGICVATAACVLVPPLNGWVDERKPGAQSGVRASCADARQLCASAWQHETKRRVTGAAAIVGLLSITIGMVNLEASDWPGLAAFCVVADGLLCLAVYLSLVKVDKMLACAAVYTFVSRAICPRSTVLFQWFHDPDGLDMLGKLKARAKFTHLSG